MFNQNKGLDRCGARFNNLSAFLAILYNYSSKQMQLNENELKFSADEKKKKSKFMQDLTEKSSF